MVIYFLNNIEWCNNVRSVNSVDIMYVNNTIIRRSRAPAPRPEPGQFELSNRLRKFAKEGFAKFRVSVVNFVNIVLQDVPQQECECLKIVSQKIVLELALVTYLVILYFVIQLYLTGG